MDEREVLQRVIEAAKAVLDADDCGPLERSALALELDAALAEAERFFGTDFL